MIVKRIQERRKIDLINERALQKIERQLEEGEQRCGDYFLLAYRNNQQGLPYRPVPHKDSDLTFSFEVWVPYDRVRVKIDDKKKIPTAEALPAKVPDAESDILIRVSRDDYKKAKCLSKLEP